MTISRAIAALMPVAVLFSGCGKKEQATAESPEVVVTKPVIKKVATVNEFTTRIEAKESVEVRARVNGYLQETLFKDGDMVKKDDVLFVIDPKPFEADVQKAQGQLKEAESKVELTSANAKRADQLIKENVISRVEYEKLITDNQAAAAAVQAARGTLETAQLNLKYSRVTAPFTGKIEEDVGFLVASKIG
ncbi:MAG TPA: efflux RND transporter periplasmic adaptor subunit, partial [Verrucomicrobiae bacterium]|nr:efflux RND transporter periplasmic adaptor subunit [Verrucomicrobiae bacterium]